MRYVKIENGTVFEQQVDANDHVRIADLTALGWVADSGTPSSEPFRQAEPVRAAFDPPPPMSAADKRRAAAMMENTIAGTSGFVSAEDATLAAASTVFEGEWPVGLPPEWFIPLRDKFGTPGAVAAASEEELLALPGATHVTVAMIRRAFAGNIEE